MLLQTLPLTPAGRYRRKLTVDLICEAKPSDLPYVTHTALIGAAQCLRGLWYRPRKDCEGCKNCGNTVLRGKDRWHTADLGLPLGGRICSPCYDYKYKRHGGGKDRPVELETRLVQFLAIQKQLSGKPAKVEPCPGCNVVRLNTNWTMLQGDLLLESGRQRWECTMCYCKPTAQLPQRDEAEVALRAGRKPLLQQLQKIDRSAKGAICPGCNKPKDLWRPPQGAFLLEPERLRFECAACYTAPTAELGDKPKSKRPQKAKPPPKSQAEIATAAARKAFRDQAGPKPAEGTLCPGCNIPMDGKLWCLPRDEFLAEPERVGWECRHCIQKPTAKLRNSRHNASS